MTHATRITFLKFSGWIFLAAGLFLIIGDFADSGRTMQDIRSALKGGLPLVALGAFFLTMAGFHQRIHQLEQENAALRAERERWRQAAGNG